MSFEKYEKSSITLEMQDLMDRRTALETEIMNGQIGIQDEVTIKKHYHPSAIDMELRRPPLLTQEIHRQIQSLKVFLNHFNYSKMSEVQEITQEAKMKHYSG